MSRSRATILVVVVALIGVVGLAALAYAFLRPTEEASGEIEAIPLNVTDLDTSSSANTDAGDGVSGDSDASSSTSQEEAPTAATEVTEPEATEPAATEEATTEPTPTEPPATETPVPTLFLFAIVQDESEVRFNIDEVLRGNPKTVVGVTNQVAGEILFDPSDAAAAQIGTILVNARTLVTDDNRRNRAIGNQILDTGPFEFISFTPTSISGLPSSVEPGDSVNFQITGDLTIRDVTNEEMFEATVVFVSEERLEGRASAIVIKEDYGLIIPNVPFVANVGEEVLLEIDFVALPVE